MSVLLFLLCACSATLAVPTAEYYELEEADLLFERFIQEHNKVYADDDEKKIRFQIFKENLEQANRLNEESKHAVYGITKFMDMTTDEFVNMYTGFRRNSYTGFRRNSYTGFRRYSHWFDDFCSVVLESNIDDVDVPESYDWREHNVVTHVKHQGYCGSCYAFSATGNMEGQYAIKHNQLIELSEQQIIDCDKTQKGCCGGLPTRAFKTLMKGDGIQAEDSYHYAEKLSQCKFNSSLAAVKVIGCNSYFLHSQEALKRLVVSVGPISVGKDQYLLYANCDHIAVQAAGFHTYNGGIMSEAACNVGDINHAVLLVGYGIEDDIPYWLIKNSWGTNFGEDGYIKVQRGESAHSCALMNEFISSAVVQ